jgi:hypothetical protein
VLLWQLQIRPQSNHFETSMPVFDPEPEPRILTYYDDYEPPPPEPVAPQEEEWEPLLPEDPDFEEDEIPW